MRRLIIAAVLTVGAAVIAAPTAARAAAQPARAAGNLGAAAVVTAAAPTVVSLTFDDGYATQLVGARVLAQHGMKGTFYISTGLLDQPGYLTWADADQLAAAGNEIGGHTIDHVDLTRVSATTARYQVCEDRTRLLNRGYAVTDFAYPYGYGYDDPTIRSIIQECGYKTARDAWGIGDGAVYAETIPPADPWSIRVVPSADATTLAQMEGFVTAAETHGGGWVPFYFHDICDGCTQQSVSETTLSAFADWLAARAPLGTSVQTVAQVISGPGGNQPPVASAGPDQTVAADSPVQLDGSASTDPDGDPLTYQWTQTGGPAVTLSDATAAQPTFTAPAGPATLTFQLVVGDGQITSSPDSVTITVAGAANQPPVANAGPDQSVLTKSLVQMDGSASTDPDGDPLTYQWTQTGGTKVTLSDAAAAQPTFTAPAGPATLTFQLVVSDGQASSAPDTVTIKVIKKPRR